MKRTVAALIILLALSTCSLLHIRHMKQLTESLTMEIRQSMEEYSSGKNVQAEMTLHKAMIQWDKEQLYLRIFLTHDKVSTIDECFLDVLPSLRNGDSAEGIVVYRQLLDELNKVCREEQLLLESIL